MKKIIIALIIAGTTGFSANAQSQYGQNYKVCNTGGTYKTCGTEPGSAKAGSSVSMTVQDKAQTPAATTGNNSNSKYAENYKVCQAGNGYVVCGEKATATNSTNDAATTDENVTMTAQATVPATTYYNVASNDDATDNENTYTGYYARKHVITVSYEARAPYEGLPSPQYDGPEANKERNVNYNKPSVDLAPSTGSNKGIQ